MNEGGFPSYKLLLSVDVYIHSDQRSER